MSKEYINIFKEDIVVPEIVQLKAEESLSQIKKEGMGMCIIEKNRVISKKDKKLSGVFKTCLAACACIAFLAVAGYFVASDNIMENGQEDIASNKENENRMQTFGNMFQLKVYAAEAQGASEDGYVTLEPGKSFVLMENDVIGSSVCASEDGFISYCINLPIVCEGENVERITYSINKGAFQIVEPPNSSIILEGEKYEGNLNVGSVGGEESETGDILSVTKLYKSFSISYDEQSDSHTWINICNETNLPWVTIFDDDNTLEDQVESYEAITKDVLVTYTVHYTDGTSDVADISIGGGIINPEPTGNSEKDNSYVGFELRYEK